MTIDPKAVTNYNRSREEIERFWIFAIIVAGKNSDWAAFKVSKLLRDKPSDVTPLDYLKGLGHGLRNMLVANKVGQYGRIERAIEDSYDLDLTSATLDELQRVFGVGPKTSRFFLLHTRPDARVAVLDTHILKWLSHHGADDVPTETPKTEASYRKLESVAIRLMSTVYSGLTLAQIDLLIWASYSGRLTFEV